MSKSKTKSKSKSLLGEYQTRLIDGYKDGRFTRAVVVSMLLSVGMKPTDVERMLHFSRPDR